MSKIAKLVVVCGIPEEITYLGYIIILLQNDVNIYTHMPSEQTPTVHSLGK